jgi:hypothetical protein
MSWRSGDGAAAEPTVAPDDKIATFAWHSVAMINPAAARRARRKYRRGCTINSLIARKSFPVRGGSFPCSVHEDFSETRRNPPVLPLADAGNRENSLPAGNYREFARCRYDLLT